MEIWQAWFGYPMKKATWLYFSKINAADMVAVPYCLHARGGDRRAEQRMSKQQRSATPRAFAQWLVAVARRAGMPFVVEHAGRAEKEER